MESQIIATIRPPDDIIADDAPRVYNPKTTRNLRSVNIGGLTDSFENLHMDHSALSVLVAMEKIWKTVPFLDPLPPQWEESVGLKFKKILNIQRIASTLCSPEESQKDLKQIKGATLKIISELNDYKSSIIMDDADASFFSKVLDFLMKVAKAARRRKPSCSKYSDMEEGRYNHNLLCEIVQYTEEFKKERCYQLLPEGHNFRISIENISNLCQKKIQSVENCGLTLDKISKVAHLGIETVNWPLKNFEIFIGFTDIIWDYIDVVIRKRVFNESVSCLIRECQKDSCDGTSVLHYVTCLLRYLHEGPGCIESSSKVKNRVDEICGHVEDTFVRGKFLKFWTDIMKKSCDVLNDYNVDKLLDEVLKSYKENCDKGKTVVVETITKYTLETVKHILEDLATNELSYKKVSLKEFVEACEAIQTELSFTNCKFKELRYIFNRKHSDSAETISKCLAGVNKTSIAPSMLDIFDVASKVRAQEKDKKREVSLFLKELEALFQIDGQRRNKIVLFQEHLDDISQQFRLLVSLFFHKINTNQFQKILTNLDNLLQYFQTDAHDSQVHDCFGNLSEMFLVLRPKPLKPEKSITQLCEIFGELSRIPLPNVVKKITEQFAIEVKKRLQSAFLNSEKEAGSTIFEQLTDITAHMLETVLAVDILPIAEVCLFVIKIQLVLLSFHEIENDISPERKWSLLKEFQTKITMEILDNNDGVESTKQEINESISKYKNDSPAKIIQIWKSFIENFKNSHGIEKNDTNSIFSAGCVQKNVKSIFRETCQDLNVVEVQETVIEEAEASIKDHRNRPSMETLNLFEDERSVLVKTPTVLKQENQITSYFNDMKSNFHKDIGQKCEEWAQLLEQVISEFKKEAENAPYRTDYRQVPPSDHEDKAYLIDKKKVYILLTSDVRKILTKLENGSGLRFKGTTFRLKQFRSSVANLVHNLETTSASEKMLLRFFSMTEEDSSDFNFIVKSLTENDENIYWEKAEKFRTIMNRVCCMDNKYIARNILVTFWSDAKTEVENVFKIQNPLEWDTLEYFRLPFREYLKLRDGIFDLADKNLQQESRSEKINYSIVETVLFFLQLSPIRNYFSRPGNFLSNKMALVSAVIVVILAIVVYWSSNLKNMFK